MEEFNLKDLWNYTIKNIAIFLQIIVVFVLICTIYTVIIDYPKYRVTSSIVLTGKDEYPITGGDVALNNIIIRNYSSAIESTLILDKAIENLDLDIEVKSLQKNLRVDQDPQGQKIMISVSNRNKKTACLLANEIAEVAQIELPRIYKLNNIKILDKAKKPNYYNNINIIKYFIVYIVLAIIASLTFIFIKFCFDKTIITASQIEENFDIPIIGKIPKKRREQK